VGEPRKRSVEDVFSASTAELGGSVEEDGTVSLDVKDLVALGQAIKETRKIESAAKKEVARLRELILAHQDARIGYRNDVLSIVEHETVAETDELVAVLKAEGFYESVVMTSVSVPRVKAVAENNKKVAAALKRARRVGRKVKSL